VHDLLIQHPHLSTAQISAVSRRVGRAPDRFDSQSARWEQTSADAQAIDTIEEDAQVDAELIDPSQRLADYRLAAFDMDSTLITIECVDELADFAGRKAEVAAITEAAMRGELSDYDESLRQRVALLAGLPETALARVWNERLQLSPGAETLARSLKGAGLRLLLVSGGFTWFTDRLCASLGIEYCRANVLEIENGYLTGRLIGEIVNAEVKRRTLIETCERIGCSPAQSIAIGDGANDLLMMAAAGLSVAYRAKPRVRSATRHAINHCGLDAVLRLFNEDR
jgi:phosphoserine phosphatase